MIIKLTFNLNNNLKKKINLKIRNSKNYEKFNNKFLLKFFYLNRNLKTKKNFLFQYYIVLKYRFK